MRKNVSVSLGATHQAFLLEAAAKSGQPLASFIRQGALQAAAAALATPVPDQVKLPPGRKPKSQAGRAARALGLSLRASLRAG